MRNFLVIICIAVLTLFFISGSALADIALDENEFHFNITQGETIKKEITIYNNGSEYTTGFITIRNFECGWRCPAAHLSVYKIELNPQESIKAELTVSSSILNEVKAVTLPIIFKTNITGNYNYTTLAEIHINVPSNLLFYGGILILGIALILMAVVYITKGRFRLKE